MDVPKPLSCSEAGTQQILEALIKHELDTDTEDRVLSHLKTCPACLSKMADVLYNARLRSPDEYPYPA